jgi:hypothetical protein
MMNKAVFDPGRLPESRLERWGVATLRPLLSGRALQFTLPRQLTGSASTATSAAARPIARPKTDT